MISRNKSSFHRIAYSAVLIALGVGLGYALAWVPNIELVSFTAVLGGFLLGAGYGLFVGATIFLLYSFLSPFGMAPLPLWIAQGIGGALLGLGGAVFSEHLKKPLYAASLAIAATLFYDVITNAAGYFTFPTKSTFIIYITGGIVFGAVHLLANAIIFALMFPMMIKLVKIQNIIEVNKSR